MSKFTATAPDGKVLVRNTKNHEYNYAVIVLKSEQYLRSIMEWDIKRTEKIIAEENPHASYVAAQTKRIAKVKKELAAVSDTWFDHAWRRDRESALQEAEKIAKGIREGWHPAVLVTVVRTVKVGE